MERGQIFWCGLDPVHGHEQGSTRPVVILSSDAYNGTQSPLAGIVPLTRAPVKNPIHLRFSSEDTGLEFASTVLTDHARFIERTRLRGDAIGRVRPVALALLSRQLARVFGF